MHACRRGGAQSLLLNHLLNGYPSTAAENHPCELLLLLLLLPPAVAASGSCTGGGCWHASSSTRRTASAPGGTVGGPGRAGLGGRGVMHTCAALPALAPPHAPARLPSPAVSSHVCMHACVCLYSVAPLPADFRPDYKQLGVVVGSCFAGVPLMALTATATPKARSAAGRRAPLQRSCVACAYLRPACCCSSGAPGLLPVNRPTCPCRPTHRPPFPDRPRPPPPSLNRTAPPPPPVPRRTAGAGRHHRVAAHAPRAPPIPGVVLPFQPVLRRRAGACMCGWAVCVLMGCGWVERWGGVEGGARAPHAKCVACLAVWCSPAAAPRRLLT